MSGNAHDRTAPKFSRKTIKWVATALFVAMAAVAMSATSARATLIVRDLVSGDGLGLITFDDASGFEWLDVTATLGLSYDAAELSTFVVSDGFRHANVDEVATLYTNAGVTLESFSAANFMGVQELISKLGCTSFCESDLICFPARVRRFGSC